MDAVGTLDGTGRSFRQSDIADLAVADQVCKGTYRLLNRCLGIDSVLVIEVNMLHTQSLQAALDCLPNVPRAAVDSSDVWIGRIAHYTKLGGEEHLIALCLNRPPDEFRFATMSYGFPATISRGLDSGLVFGTFSFGHDALLDYSGTLIPTEGSDGVKRFQRRSRESGPYVEQMYVAYQSALH